MTTPPLTMHHPICTSCGRPASAIYKSYTPTLIVLVRCSYCKKLVDSYGDEEYRPGGGGSRESRQGNAPTMSGSWMDLILVKPRAYRHFLYNLPFLLPAPTTTHAEKDKDKEQTNSNDDKAALPTHGTTPAESHAWRAIAKRLVALSLVDGYLRWFYLCAYSPPAATLPQSPPAYTLPNVLFKATRSLLNTAAAMRSRSDAAVLLRQIGITELMVGSYLMVWVGTLLETVAMYATVTALSSAYVVWARWRTRRDAGEKGSDGGDDGDSDGHHSSDDEDEVEAAAQLDFPGPVDVPPRGVRVLDLYRPSLIPNALLLSSLTTLLLLSIVLLWESKLPRPNTIREPPSSSTSHFDEFLPSWLVSATGLDDSRIGHDLGMVGMAFSTDFAVRTLLGGLNAGVSLAVIHPRLPVLTTSLLLLGWWSAYNVRTRFTLLPSDVGPGGATAGGHRWSAEAEAAVGWYCAAW